MVTRFLLHSSFTSLLILNALIDVLCILLYINQLVTFNYVYIIIILLVLHCSTLITVPFWSTKISPSHLLVYYPYIIKVRTTHSAPAAPTPAPLLTTPALLIMYKYVELSYPRTGLRFAFDRNLSGENFLEDLRTKREYKLSIDSPTTHNSLSCGNNKKDLKMNHFAQHFPSFLHSFSHCS